MRMLLLCFISDGCRPYIEVYQGEVRILSTQQDYDKMMLFHISHGKVRTRRTSSAALVANVHILCFFYLHFIVHFVVWFWLTFRILSFCIQVVLPLNVSVVSDVTIAVYHARHVLGRPTGIKILQYQFHTGFLSTDTKSIICTA
jgi:cyclin G-associated kinase